MLVKNERGTMRLMGTVFIPACPGATLAKGVSGMRYARVIQKPSSGLSSTSMSSNILTQ